MPEREEASTLSRLSPGVSRRSFLGTTGVAAASLSVSGTAAAGSCSRKDTGDGGQDVDLKKASTDEVELQTESPQSESVPDIDYDTVINVVEAGADNTGGESISPVVQELVDDNTLLKFPEGRYYVDRKVRFTGFENFGIVGDNATLVPAPADEYESESRMFKFGVHYNPGRNLEVRNFTVDYSAPNTGLRAFDMTVADGLIAENITFEGVHDAGTWGPMHVDIVGSGGYGIVKNVKMPEGGVWTQNTAQDATPSVKWGPTGFLLSPYHSGRLDVVDTVIGGFPDNGLYDSESPGQVLVKGGRFQNSNSGNIRITGDGSGIYGAHVVVNQNRPEDNGQHGIRLDGGKNLTIADSKIEMTKPNGHAIFARNPVESMMIKDTDVVFRNNNERDSINAIAMREGAGKLLIDGGSIVQDHAGNALELLEGEGPAVVKGLSVKGESTGETGGRNAIYCKRNGSEFHNLDVDLPNGSRRRALGIFADNVLVKGGNYASSGRPITIEGTDVLVRNVTAGSYNGDVAVKVVDGSAKLLDNTLYEGVSGSNVATSGNEYK